MSAVIFLVGVLLGGALGWYSALIRARRAADAMMVASMARLGVSPQALTRAIRAPEVDHHAQRVARKRGTAAFADIMLEGEEVTLVSADERFLTRLGQALWQHRDAIQQTMREKLVDARR